MQAGGAIEVAIGERIEDVEAGDPGADRDHEQAGRPAEVAAHRDPGAGRPGGDRQAQEQMAERRESLGERVAVEKKQRDRRQRQTERPQRRGGAHEHGGRDQGHRPGGAHRDRAGGNLALGGPRVLGVDVAVDDPVEPHRRRAGAGHGDHDAGEARDREAVAAGGDGGGGHRERQREQRVLELDHPPEISRPPSSVPARVSSGGAAVSCVGHPA